MGPPLGFLEAHTLAQGEPVGPPRAVRLVMSGTPDVLSIFLRAEGRRRGRELDIGPIPFNTLHQWLREDGGSGPEEEWVILFPWDLVPGLDWRSGISRPPSSLEALADEARQTASLLKGRRVAAAWYVPAPLPPVLGRSGELERLAHQLSGLAAEAGAVSLGEGLFDLTSYVSSGSPIDPRAAGRMAAAIVDGAEARKPVPAKVLITDLDNVMWHGVVGEDGVEGLSCGPEGTGFRHFIYQGLLGRLKDEGVLLCAVSRNDPDLARAPFERGITSLSEGDFLTIVGSYEAKSAQIRAIAETLNLGLDAFVFIDDNPVELAEVEAALPQVRIVPFPDDEGALPGFLDEVRDAFARAADLTDEDRHRTELYRARMGGLEASTRDGADLADFLGSLDMELTLRDRGRGDRTRAVQLINKTNQFNLNGRRMGDDEVARVLEDGGALFAASLSDRHGDHGEIAALLVDSEGAVASWVMSCRVFQRRVEHAFLLSVLARHPLSRFRFAETERNTPIRAFLSDSAFRDGEAGLILDPDEFRERHGGVMDLFRISEWE